MAIDTDTVLSSLINMFNSLFMYGLTDMFDNIDNLFIPDDKLSFDLLDLSIFNGCYYTMSVGNIKEKQNPYANLVYPRLNEYGYSYDIMVAKEENKYRFNQFWDIVKDRGEYSYLEQPFFKTRANGFEKDLVINTVDYNKFITDRKKFRHYETKVILKRIINDEKNKMPKMILKLANNKLLNSLR